MRDLVRNPITFEEKQRALDWALCRYKQWLTKSHIHGDTVGAALLAIKNDLDNHYKEDVS